jgi:hypothetical protein
LAFGHPKGPWGDSVTPKKGLGGGLGQNGVAGHPHVAQRGGSANPKFFFFFFFYLLKKNLKIKIIYIWQLRVAILMVLCVANVKIRQFWMEKLTDVLFLSFSTTQISPMKKMKTV